MSKILTCGELKSITFETYKGDNSGKVVMSNDELKESDSKEDINFGLRVHKKTTKVKRNRDKNSKETLNNTMKIKPGAKIMKIDTVDDYNSMINRFSTEEKITTEINKITVSDVKDYNQVLANLSKEYDGLYISKHILNTLQGHKNPIIGEIENLRVLNRNIITTQDDNSSYKRKDEGKVSSKNTVLKSSTKEIISEAHNHKIILDTLNSSIVKNTLFRTQPIFKGNESLNKFNNQVNEFKNKLSSNKLFKNLKINTIVDNQKIKSNKNKDNIYLNNNSIIQSNKIINGLYALKHKTLPNKISLEDSTAAYGLYEIGKSKGKYFKEDISEIDYLHSKSNRTYDNKILRDSEDRAIISKKEAIKYFKEKAHQEKLAWQYAMEHSNNKESIRVHAVFELAKYTEIHQDIKSGKLKTFTSGEIEFKIDEN